MDLLIVLLLAISSSISLSEAKDSQAFALTYFIEEESPQNTIVAKLSDDVEQMFGKFSSRSSSFAPLNLMLTNWQDAGPRHFTIDQTKGYLIVTAKPDRETLCPESSSGTRFSFPSPYNGIDFSPTGAKRITGPEAADRPCTLVLKLVCTGQPSQDDEVAPFDPILVTVNVIVKDINDISPTFPQPRMNFELGETSSVVGETTIPLPAASDLDAGANATLSYWLEESRQRVGSNSTIPFALEGLVDGQPLRLRLIQPLDYEKIREYDFSLCVEDHGRPNPRSGKLKIHVDVLDENDNAPVFSKPAYFVSINETLPRGSVLMDIQATDKDSNRNGQIMFELPNPMTDEAKIVQQYFDVRTSTHGYAKLYLRQSPDPDFDLQQKQSQAQLQQHSQDGVFIRRSRDFVLRLVASDNGTPRRQTAEALVTIRVLDVNDMAPKISVSYINPCENPGGVCGGSQRGQGGRLRENVDRAFLAFVSVQDLDSGPWGQVSCRTDNDAFKLVSMGEGQLESSAPTSHYGIADATTPQLANEEITFKLMAQKAFDREEVPQVKINLCHKLARNLV